MSLANTIAVDDRQLPSDDIQVTAWCIAAKHLTAGQKDVTKMIADGIRQERTRCADLLRAALGSEAIHLSTFLEDPRSNW